MAPYGKVSFPDPNASIEQIVANVSTVKWTPDKVRSPWHDIDNLVPRPPITPFRYFLEFPTEIILYVAQFLPKESVVALALTSKAMFRLLGGKVFDDLTDEERWRLVLLLERDSTLMMACHCCGKLHNGVTRAMPPRDFLFNRTMTCNNSESSPAFSRLVTRQYLRQQPYAEFLGVVSSDKYLSLPDYKVHLSKSVRMVQGHLMVRSEAIIVFSLFPVTEAAVEVDQLHNEKTVSDRNSDEEIVGPRRTITGRAGYLFNRLDLDSSGTDSYDGYRISCGCQHLNCNDLQVGFPRPEPKPLSSDDAQLKLQFPVRTYYDRRRDFDAMEALITDHDELHHSQTIRPFGSILDVNVNSHPATCYGTSLIEPDVLRDALPPVMSCALLHPQPCRIPECEKYTVGFVRSCPECFTDTCVSARDVEGIGRVIGITTWKDLGGVTPELGLAASLSHIKVGPFDSINAKHQPPPRHTLAAAGSIHARFEGVTDPPGKAPRTGNQKGGKRGRRAAKVVKRLAGRDVVHSGYRYTAVIGKKALRVFKNPSPNEPQAIRVLLPGY